MSEETRMDGRKVIVTGASSGLGAATARLCAARGAKVALMARSADVIEKTAAELGEGAVAIPVDISDPEAVAKAVAEAEEKMGGIDGLVNAAGVDGPSTLEDLDADVWRRVLSINLDGAFYISREVALRMGEGGSIVHIGSELSTIGMGLYVHYCASKAGVIGLTKALAAELAPKIRVNAVCPGPIDTPMMDAELEWFDDPVAAREGAIDRVPLKRFSTPEEVAEAVCFFLDRAAFATGSIVALDGGTTAI